MSVPDGLSERGSALWSATTRRYELREDELRVLEDACREADLIDRMDSALSASGMMVSGSMGQDRVHPLVGEIRQHRTVLASLLRTLKLPDEGGAGVVNQQRAAGSASWASRRGA